MSEAKLEPMGDHVVVTPIPEEKEMTLGTLTLVIPDSVQDKPNRGCVVAVGEGRVVDGKMRPIKLKEGDRVLFSKYAGNDFFIGQEHFISLSYDDILVKLAPPEKAKKAEAKP